MKYFTAFLLSLLFYCSPFQGKVIEMENLSLLEEKVGGFNSDTLVLFDVDNTLIMLSDAVLQPQGKQLSKSLISKIQNWTNTIKYPDGFLLGKVLLAAKWDVVDPKNVPLIQQLQERNIPVLAFTGAGTKKVGEIESFADFRIEQLERHGFNFKKTLNLPDDFQFANEVLLKSGVLFCSEQSKGDVLKTFLKEFQLSPQKIVFIDDRKDFIESVEEAMSEIGIECFCIHYTAIENTSVILDEKIAEFQFHHLFENGEWLSDEHANAHLSSRIGS